MSMWRENTAHWISTHSYTCQIVFIDFRGGVVLVANILEGLTEGLRLAKIKGLLPSLACSNEFGFGSRQRSNEGGSSKR